MTLTSHHASKACDLAVFLPLRVYIYIVYTYIYIFQLLKATFDQTLWPKSFEKTWKNLGNLGKSLSTSYGSLAEHRKISGFFRWWACACPIREQQRRQVNALDMCCLKPYSRPRHSAILFRWLLFRQGGRHVSKQLWCMYWNHVNTCLPHWQLTTGPSWSFIEPGDRWPKTLAHWPWKSRPIRFRG